MADDEANRRDIMLVAKAVRGIGEDLDAFIEALRVGDAKLVGDLYMQIREATRSADSAIRRVAVESFADVYDDNGKLAEFNAENWPWFMQTRPRA